LDVENDIISNHSIIVINHLGHDAYFYMESMLQEIYGFIDIVPARHEEETGDFRILVTNNFFAKSGTTSKKIFTSSAKKRSNRVQRKKGIDMYIHCKKLQYLRMLFLAEMNEALGNKANKCMQTRHITSTIIDPIDQTLQQSVVQTEDDLLHHQDQARATAVFPDRCRYRTSATSEFHLWKPKGQFVRINDYSQRQDTNFKPIVNIIM
jgi:hypothetical protein